MDAARYDPTHISSFHPSTLSITVIGKEKVAFGTAAKGRRTYGDMSPLKPYLSKMWSLQNLFITEILIFMAYALMRWYDQVLSFKHSIRSFLSFHFSIVMDLGRVGWSSITLSESVTQNMPQNLNYHVSVERARNFWELVTNTFVHQRTLASSLTDTHPHCDWDVFR